MISIFFSFPFELIKLKIAFFIGFLLTRTSVICFRTSWPFQNAFSNLAIFISVTCVFFSSNIFMNVLLHLTILNSELRITKPASFTESNMVFTNSLLSVRKRSSFFWELIFYTIFTRYFSPRSFVTDTDSPNTQIGVPSLCTK